jgi:hypothetical protein
MPSFEAKCSAMAGKWNPFLCDAKPWHSIAQCCAEKGPGAGGAAAAAGSVKMPARVSPQGLLKDTVACFNIMLCEGLESDLLVQISLMGYQTKAEGGEQRHAVKGAHTLVDATESRCSVCNYEIVPWQSQQW